MLNNVTIMGRLTKDPELRYTQSDIPVASFTVACERDVKSKDGNKVTDFINCIAWRNTGEFISKYFQKGSMIVVSGRLEVRSYEKDGEKRTAAEVNVGSAYFGESKSRDSKQDSRPHDGGFEEIDDDAGLPF